MMRPKHVFQSQKVAKNSRVIARSSGPVAKGFSVEVTLHDLGNGVTYMSFNWHPFQPTDAEIDSFGKEYDAILAPVFAVALGKKLPLQPHQ